MSERQMSLLVALKIAGIKAEVATDVLHVLENENQAKELEAFVVANKPLSEKALLSKVKEFKLWNNIETTNNNSFLEDDYFYLDDIKYVIKNKGNANRLNIYYDMLLEVN